MITKRQKSPIVRDYYKGSFKIDVKNKVIAVSDGVKSVTTVKEILRW